MRPEEGAAKAAFEAMRGTYVARHPQRERITALDSWERQSPECREDWIAAIRAAVAEEREACARLADELGALYEIRDYDDPEAKEKGGYAVTTIDFSAAIRARVEK